ncbi:MAG: ATP-binding protein [Candidatus Hydrogenedentota bacterium]
MRLISIYLENFRAYREPARIDLDDFTAFIGRNDVGKSTILEAMEIFFNNETVKIDKGDRSVGADGTAISIGCEFSDFPESVVLDASATTDLSSEHLLNGRGNLEIRKVFECSGAKVKPEVFAMACHPCDKGLDDLLSLKNKQLKERMKELAVQSESATLSSNPSIRKALWVSRELSFEERLINLNDEDAKRIWLKLEEQMPIFALFQADRPSRDDDTEVQDPMKLAMMEAVKSVDNELQKIREVVKEKVMEVAERTLDKLRQIDPSLAGKLTPTFTSEPKWDGFKLTLTGENDIPINKRGSGVRRLILLSFFRAEAERKREQKTAPSIIYAIEEPEASQHPNNQKMIAEALLDLADSPGCQVFITTHVPGLANVIPVGSLRHIYRNSGGINCVDSGKDDGVARAIADTLGSLPDNRIKLILYVEGPNDVVFLKAISRKYKGIDSHLIDINDDPRVAILPVGGSNLREWVTQEYLKGLDYPQIHIYDRGRGIPPKYQGSHDEINCRENQRCFLTDRNEMENYLHHGAINRCLGLRLTAFEPMEDVPEIVAKAIHESDQSPEKKEWTVIALGENGTQKIDMKVKKAKRRLNLEVANAMTIEELTQIDSDGEMRKWLDHVSYAVAHGTLKNQ